MFPLTKKLLYFVLPVILISGVIAYFSNQEKSDLPLVAIANYGPHPSLDDTIAGFKKGMVDRGYVEGETIRYEVQHVNFQFTLIMQMLSKLKASQPDVLVAISTPIAQAAKTQLKNVPIVFADITDPVEAGLLSTKHKAEMNLTGASDQQNLDAFVEFAKGILPNAKNIGLLYSTAEANDKALREMLNEASTKFGMHVQAVPIDEPREVPLKMQLLKGQVDLIYVGSSGVIQSAMPMIIKEADQMMIPVFNFDAEAARRHEVFASYGVSYPKVGDNVAALVDAILKGKNAEDLPPLYPALKDHFGVISLKKASKLGIKLPSNLSNIELAE